MEIIPIFPTLIFQSNIPVPEGMAKWCEKYAGINKSEFFSNRGGYHSPMNIPDNPEFKKFFDYFVENLQKDNPLPSYSIDSCWFIVNEKGHYNVPHRHPNCDYSFVWYIKAPSNGPPIVFENDHQYSRFNSFQLFDSELLNMYNYAGNYWWKPLDGDLLIFPSDLMHGVEPNKTDESRIIFSGNITFNKEKQKS